MKKVNFITAIDGAIELRADGEFVGKSNHAPWLAQMILERGGPADQIMGSSSCDHADEYGFETQRDFDILWDSVCEML